MDRKLNRIKVMLVDKEKTNRWLATQLGKDPATVSKWCTNTAQPSLETMMQIAKLLEVNMNELVRFEALPEILPPDENKIGTEEQ
ncbi:MAG: helix-turn-helix transcriptional regulator [Bacteroidales bacterium]|nr:helix-turn-helix transcriptional regulator [Candidatus Cacconaster scatequi]